MSEPLKSPNVTVARALQEVGRAKVSALIKLTGRTQKSVINTLKNLYHQSKIHIGGYEVNKRGQVSKVWVWGDGDDAREPLMVSNKQAFVPRPDEAAAWLRNPV
jgi:hypothetical protein